MAMGDNHTTDIIRLNASGTHVCYERASHTCRMIQVREDRCSAGAEIAGSSINQHLVVSGIDEETGIRRGDLRARKAVFAQGRLHLLQRRVGKKALYRI